jgi:hypothetical protein
MLIMTSIVSMSHVSELLLRFSSTTRQLIISLNAAVADRAVPQHRGEPPPFADADLPMHPYLCCRQQWSAGAMAWHSQR